MPTGAADTPLENFEIESPEREYPQKTSRGERLLMMNDTKTSARRRPYERPRLEKVPLRPREAVLGHCKVSGGPGPFSVSCANTGCASVGS